MRFEYCIWICCIIISSILEAYRFLFIKKAYHVFTYFLPIGPCLGRVWHGSGAELQRLQLIFQPNTPALKLHEAANSMEL